MKKIISILGILFFACAIHAQVLSFKQTDIQKTYKGTAGDTLNASFLLAKSVYVNKDFFYHVNVQLEADSAGDGTNITARLRGSYDNATWENVGSAVVWYLASADTIIKINSFSYAESLTSDTTGYKNYFPESVTITRTTPGLTYPYLQVHFLGNTGADMLLTKFTMRIIKAN